MLASHYAPGAARAARCRGGAAGRGAARLRAVRASPDPERAAAILNLSPSGDLREAAANLFSMVQALDRSGAAAIAVEPIPHTGLGEAINDRLRRAAAPRDMPLDRPRFCRWTLQFDDSTRL